jgi:hypothetical protein
VGYYSDPRIGKGRYYAENVALNLSTPEGMCHAARWLAERLDYPLGPTAPDWSRRPCERSDGAYQLAWTLDGHESRVFWVDDSGLPGFVPSGATAVEAMRVACLAVGGTHG